jgi:hypothetical protein
MIEKSKSERRSHYQALAYRRYRRMTWLRGDGEWLVLSKCYSPWAYVLVTDRDDALMLATKWDQERCGTSCKGRTEHAMWRML